jgi:hypothetical protein
MKARFFNKTRSGYVNPRFFCSCLAQASTRTQSFAIEGRRPRPKGQRDGKKGKRTSKMQLEMLWTMVQPAVQGQDRFFDKGPTCRAEASPGDRSYVLPPSPPPPPSPAALLFAWSAAGRRLTRRSVSIWPEGHDHKVQRPSLSVWHNLRKRGNKKTRGLQCLSDLLQEPARMSFPLS